MNENQFRSNSQARDSLKEFLSSQLGLVVFAICTNKQTPGRMPDAATLPPSERVHLYAQNQAFQAGWHECLKFIAGLTEAPPETKEQPKTPALKRTASQPPIQTTI